MGGQAQSRLALFGGTPHIRRSANKLFAWPMVTREDERAVVEVLRHGTMSGTAITKQFEREFAEWFGAGYVLGFCNGTASLLAAMWACGVGAGDEIICPSMTYWASAAPALMLGGTVNFCDIDRNTLCIDVGDIEARISSRTKAIVVTHYAGYPCDMDTISSIAKSHGVHVIEDVSHAHGGLYKGSRLGTLGDISAMSLMTGKSFPIGEAGMILTDSQELYERAVAFAHYERTGAPSRFNPPDQQVTMPELTPYAGIPLGALKGRMNQTCAAMGRVQLAQYPRRMREIQDAMNCFWDLVGDLPGLKPHRVPPDSASTMGGWYYPQGLYFAEELDGLPAERFCQAINAEGISWCFPGGNKPLHLHPFFNEADIFRMGTPTSLSFGQRDVRQNKGDLPVSESIEKISIAVPWFKMYRPRHIRRYAEAFRKVAENAAELLSEPSAAE